jgi:hypothetical protein
VQQSRTNGFVIYEKTAMTSPTVGHENDGYADSNVTSLSFTSRQKRRHCRAYSFFVMVCLKMRKA